ncbi:hypothetical protein D3C85_1153200 [compost metagenome]
MAGSAPSAVAATVTVVFVPSKTLMVAGALLTVTEGLSDSVKVAIMISTPSTMASLNTGMLMVAVV